MSTTNLTSTLRKVIIGGSEQWVLERTEDPTNPIVLFVHGGPGTSQLTSNRRNTRDLERWFTVVNWDQRGAGKSYAAIKDVKAMNLGQFVDDAHELTVQLLERYGKDRLVLVGHSWGTVVGAIEVARNPELYSAYVGIGQISNMAEGESLSYHWALEQAHQRHKRRAIRSLERIGPPPYTGEWQRKTITERSYVARFGGEVHSSSLGAAGIVLRNLLVSSEYTVRDRLNYFRGIAGSMRFLWPELLEVDLFTQVPEMNVPVVFMEGRHDWEVPSVLSARYFDALRAPSKQLIWFESSAHLPNTEERARFNQIMRDHVRPLALGSAGRPSET